MKLIRRGLAAKGSITMFQKFPLKTSIFVLFDQTILLQKNQVSWNDDEYLLAKT